MYKIVAQIKYKGKLSDLGSNSFIDAFFYFKWNKMKFCFNRLRLHNSFGTIFFSVRTSGHGHKLKV